MPEQFLRMSEYAWLFRYMSEYVWICRDMREYALISLNSFCFTFPRWLHYITRGYLFEGLQENRGYSLKEHEAVFLKRLNLTFSLAAGSIIRLFFVLD